MFAFQQRVVMDRGLSPSVVEHAHDEHIRFVERSPAVQLETFVRASCFPPDELEVIEKLYELSMNMWQPVRFIHLRASPRRSFERMQGRVRDAELGLGQNCEQVGLLQARKRKLDGRQRRRRRARSSSAAARLEGVLDVIRQLVVRVDPEVGQSEVARGQRLHLEGVRHAHPRARALGHSAPLAMRSFWGRRRSPGSAMRRVILGTLNGEVAEVNESTPISRAARESIARRFLAYMALEPKRSEPAFVHTTTDVLVPDVRCDRLSHPSVAYYSDCACSSASAGGVVSMSESDPDATHFWWHGPHTPEHAGGEAFEMPGSAHAMPVFGTKLAWKRATLALLADAGHKVEHGYAKLSPIL